MKKILTFEQYFIIKRMFLTNDFKPILNNVYYNPDEKHVVSTNGHLMRIEKMDLGKRPLLFSKENFKLSLKAYKNEYGDGKIKLSLIVPINKEKPIMRFRVAPHIFSPLPILKPKCI